MIRVLTVGGLDPSGGAGIGADTRTLAGEGALALPVAAALTVQNRHRLQRVVPVEPSLLREMLQAAAGDGPLHAVKTGLLPGPRQVEVVADWLQQAGDLPVVVDPVLAASAGGWQAGRELVEALRSALLPRASVATPNLPELEILAAGDPRELLRLGCGAVLVKGGHGSGDELVDLLVAAGCRREFRHPRLPVGDPHGTGCALASWLARFLGEGRGLEAACAAAIESLQQRLRAQD